jgi:hypothetical protein
LFRKRLLVGIENGVRRLFFRVAFKSQERIYRIGIGEIIIKDIIGLESR